MNHRYFRQGETVRIKHGCFEDFEGTVEHIDAFAETLKVSIRIFGRPTSIDLDFDQVEKPWRQSGT